MIEKKIKTGIIFDADKLEILIDKICVAYHDDGTIKPTNEDWEILMNILSFTSAHAVKE